MFRKVTWVLMFLPMFSGIQGQDNLKIKFGQITPEDFVITSPLLDSNVNAIIIADVGKSEFERGSKSDFAIAFTHHRRVKIVNRNGFDVANLEIPLVTIGDDEEKIIELDAATYNLVDGKVIKSKLENKNIYKQKINRNLVVSRLTFPNVKEGSIIEYSYRVKSDFVYNLQPWSFQGEYPCLWSEYEVDIPDFYTYVFINRGYLPFDINQKTAFHKTYHIGTGSSSIGIDNVNFDATVTATRMVIKEVPALREQEFTTTLSNHVAKIEFQLSRGRSSGTSETDVINSWKQASARVLLNGDFGLPIMAQNKWLNVPIKKITAGATNNTEIAQKIFQYIRDNFTVTRHEGFEMDADSLQGVFEKKSGTVGDINLLLIAMLRHEKIVAEPVVLSTRDNGVVPANYPSLRKYNYLVCIARPDSTNYMLDASVAHLGFGKLPESCYNGDARLIREDPGVITLNPEDKQELSSTFVFLNKGKEGLDGYCSAVLGDQASLRVRNALLKAKGDNDNYLKAIRTSFTDDITLSNLSFDSLTLCEMPVGINYDMKLKLPDEDIVYFNPMLNTATKSNPFSSAKRLYPIEMPHTTDATYVLNMDVPEGYKIDELPKSARIRLADDEGLFEYTAEAGTDGKVQISTRLRINKATFPADHYEALRDFYAHIIRKESEQIVFKKIK